MSEKLEVTTKEGSKLKGSPLSVILYSVAISLASSFITSSKWVGSIETTVQNNKETLKQHDMRFVTIERFNDLTKTVDKIDVKIDYIITNQIKRIP